MNEKNSSSNRARPAGSLLSSLRENIRAKSPAASQEAISAEATSPTVRPKGKMPGAEASNEFGSYWLREEKYPLDSRHGYFRLGAIESISLPGVRRLLKLKAEPAPPRTWLFLDTETDGLMGGAGCHAFTIGVGWLEDGAFVLRQYLMRDHSEERAMLKDLASLLDRFEATVTFNGKTFDLGILDARFTVNRIDRQAGDLAAFDLLHASRRIWKRRLPDCRMGTIEREILGVWRVDDTPGSEIPWIYSQYLRSKDDGLMAGPLEHNRLDVLSMATLFWMGAEIFQPGSSMLEKLPAEDLMGVAAALADHEPEEARSCLELALHKSGFEQKGEIQKNLSLLLKKEFGHQQASGIWRSMIDERGVSSGILPYEELAKVLEHRERRFVEALEVTIECLNRLDEAAPNVFEREAREKLLHRAGRLKRKISARPPETGREDKNALPPTRL